MPQVVPRGTKDPDEVETRVLEESLVFRRQDGVDQGRRQVVVAHGAAMSNNPLVQSAFPIVVFGAVALSVVMSLIFLFSRGSSYENAAA